MHPWPWYTGIQVYRQKIGIQLVYRYTGIQLVYRNAAGIQVYGRSTHGVEKGRYTGIQDTL